MVMPIGFLLNDTMIYYNINDVIKKYKVTVLVIWYPVQHKDLQGRIDKFLEQIIATSPKITVIKADEEYSSVQAWATLWTFQKNPAEDTLAAMHILEHFLNRYPLEKQKK
jgi:RNase H-fold protein (predicted Holliday junction resolvase)